MWTHEVIGTYAPEDIEYFGVKKIPAHGNVTYKFTLLDASSVPSYLIQ